MLPRRRFHPTDHLSIGVPLKHSHGLACGEMLFIGGQADIGADTKVSQPNDLPAQTAIAMQGVHKVLAGLGADAADLVKLTAFYVADEDANEDALLRDLATQLGDIAGPGPAVTLVPLETNCFEGLSIEIEAIAMRGHNGERLTRSSAWIPDGAILPARFSQALRCGEMMFTSGQTATDATGQVLHPGSLSAQSHIVLDKLNTLLRALGADLHDAVKTNVFNVEPGVQDEWKAAARVRASYYREPGPAATGLSLPRPIPHATNGGDLMVRNDVIAMRAVDGTRLPRQGVWPSGHWDWPIHLPYRHGLKVGDFIFLGGQVSLTPDGAVIDPGNIEAQTHCAMQNIENVLAEFDLGLEHLVKINTFYVGTNGEHDLIKNASIRADYYREPGPASTGIPFPYLAYEHMLIEIDAVAMV